MFDRQIYQKHCLRLIGIFSFLIVLSMSTDVYGGTRGVVTGDRVNVRSYGALSDNNRLFQVSRGQAVDIYDLSGDFFRVTVQGASAVYISREWVRISETIGFINSDTAWVYDLPSEEGGTPKGMLSGGSTVVVTSVFNNWYGINYMGSTAFISSWDVDIPSFVELPQTRLPGSQTIADEIIELAMQYLGTRYAWGGNGPNSFDCSGFMVYILRPFGITVNRRSADMALNGHYVPRHALEPGDLVFFATTGGSRISHVGMYIGGGDFIHSSSWRSGVTIDSLYHSYYARTYATARRVL